MNGQTEEEFLQASDDNKRFLNFFERIKIEFPGTSEDLYPPVEWIKAKSNTGSAFDCIEIIRSLTKE
jgi:hypothetical protein